jgi:PAS domain S-box-containing protein
MRPDSFASDSQSFSPPPEPVVTSEERLRILLESVQDYAIYLLDADGCIISWNSGAEKIKGYSAQEVLGRHFSMFYPPDDVANGTPDAELATAARTGRVEDEGWRVRKDGTMFWANVVITAVYDASGGNGRTLRGFAKVTRDMTERKRLRELEAASQHMNEFLATLAHELRNPLAPVSNALSVMMLEPLVSPTLRQCRDMIDRQISHLTRLVDDLLDAGRVTTGKVMLRLEPVELSDVVVRAIEMIRPHMASRQQAIEVHVPPTNIVVNGDGTRLVQVLQGLLNNASKFSEHGGRIGIELDKVGAFARVRVSDEGCGIDAAAIDSIFNLFVQADNRFERKESGLGIGLTLCRWLVEMHGGSIEASSEGLGRGATFTVRLPLFTVQDAANDEGMNGDRRERSEHATLAVLVVDDNGDSADSMAMLLRMKGHRVQVAYSGAEALDAAERAERIDVALIDIAMPGADGFAVLRQLKGTKALSGACFAAMTGFGQESDVARSLDQGFDLHLTKPVQLPLLDTLLARAQERRTQQ